jgi:predicted P-loop ATPase
MIEQPRQSVFVGTTNADGYLRDESGGRRFWPVAVTTIDCDMMERDRDQLFAEAVQLFREGQKWWLTERGHLLEAAEAQADRYDGDPWTDKVQSYVSTQQNVSIEELLQLCLCLGTEKWGQVEQNRVARILKYSGWKRYQFRKGQARQWRYQRITQPGTDDEGGTR